ncbi:MAG TPA: dienelactone hydrolase family protein [Candidatus Limnocylindria bacterium]|nr:dienelactone hydrolase family protein [Candidatus Limnocylindria bacterium]
MWGATGLKLLRGDPALEELVARFAGAYVPPPRTTTDELRETHRPKGRAPSHGWPVVVALHGNNSTLALERGHWMAANGAGWAVELLQSVVPSWVPGFAVWDDDALAERQIRDAVTRLRAERDIDGSRVVVAGYSAGGYRAVQHVLKPDALTRTVVAMAAWLPAEVAETMAADAADLASVRAYLLVGELDASRAGHALLASRVSAAGGTCVVEERPGMGHTFPGDFGHALVRALAEVEA